MWTGEERLNYAEAFVKYHGEALRLDFWQQEFLKDKAKYSIILKSRRTGFSFITALKGLVKAMDYDRIGYVRQFVSYREDDAIEKIRYAKEFYESIPDKCKKPLVSCTTTSMEFLDANGKTTSRLISLACKPPRGNGGDLVFDEMAIYPPRQMHEIYTGGLPVISRGGCIEIGSTPLGSKGDFYDIYKDKSHFKEYRRYTIPWWLSSALVSEKDDDEATVLAKIETAASECPNLPTEERVAKCGSQSLRTAYASMDEETFQQEFECTFIDSAQSFLSLDMIHSCVDEGLRVAKSADDLLIDYDEERDGALYVGYDVARRRDAAVIFAIGKTADGKKRALAEIVMRDTSFDAQKAELRKILDGLRVVRCCMDAGGMGEPLAEDLQKQYGSARIEAVRFNAEVKEEMAIGVKCGLERGDFVIHSSPNFIRQLHSIKRTAGALGRFKYDAERDENGHADSFWAWALANLAITSSERHTSRYWTQWAQKKAAEGANDASASQDAPQSQGAKKIRPKSRAALMRTMLGRRSD